MTPNDSTWLALVALPYAELPEVGAVADRLAGDDGAAPQVSSQTANMATLKWGDSVLAFTLVPQPIPSEQLAGPASCAWYWPAAVDELSHHTAHLLVAMIDEQPGLLRRATRFTAFLRAVLESSPAIGVQWGASRAVHEAKAFCEVAKKMSEDDLPLHLWIDFRCEQTETPGAVRLFTTGLKALGHPELEVRQFAGEPATLIGHAYNVAHYMLQKSKTLQDGEALGLADETQVTLRTGESMLGDGQEVVELVFG